MLKRVMYHNDDFLLADDDDGGDVWESTDGGSTWTVLTSAGRRLNALFRVESSGAYLAIADDGSVYRSTAGGSSWTNTDTLCSAPLGPNGYLEDPDGDILIGEYSSDSAVHSVMHSTDDGQSFSSVLDSRNTSPSHVQGPV